MAIAFDATSSAYPSASSPQTLTHTCTGSNRFLVVAVSTLNDTVTSVTYNGVAMTNAVKSTYPAAAVAGIGLWYLVNPASGANTISVSTSAGVIFAILASSYTGVSQTGQPDGTGAGTVSSSATQNVTLTVTASNCWIVAAAAQSTGGSTTPGAGVVRQESAAGGNDGNGTLYDSNATVSTGSVTFASTYSASMGAGRQCAFSFSPSIATATGGFFFAAL